MIPKLAPLYDEEKFHMPIGGFVWELMGGVSSAKMGNMPFSSLPAPPKRPALFDRFPVLRVVKKRQEGKSKSTRGFVWVDTDPLMILCNRYNDLRSCHTLDAPYDMRLGNYTYLYTPYMASVFAGANSPYDPVPAKSGHTGDHLGFPIRPYQAAANVTFVRDRDQLPYLYLSRCYCSTTREYPWEATIVRYLNNMCRRLGIGLALAESQWATIPLTNDRQIGVAPWAREVTDVRRFEHAGKVGFDAPEDTTEFRTPPFLSPFGGDSVTAGYFQNASESDDLYYRSVSGFPYEGYLFMTGDGYVVRKPTRGMEFAPEPCALSHATWSESVHPPVKIDPSGFDARCHNCGDHLRRKDGIPYDDRVDNGRQALLCAHCGERGECARCGKQVLNVSLESRQYEIGEYRLYCGDCRSGLSSCCACSTVSNDEGYFLPVVWREGEVVKFCPHCFGRRKAREGDIKTCETCGTNWRSKRESWEDLGDVPDCPVCPPKPKKTKAVKPRGDFTSPSAFSGSGEGHVAITYGVSRGRGVEWGERTPRIDPNLDVSVTFAEMMRGMGVEIPIFDDAEREGGE